MGGQAEGQAEGHAVGQAAANVVAVSQAGALPAGAGVLPFPERPPRAGRSLSPRGPHTTLSGGVLGNGPRRGRQAGDAVRGQGHLPSESPPESAGGRGAGVCRWPGLRPRGRAAAPAQGPRPTEQQRPRLRFRPRWGSRLRFSRFLGWFRFSQSPRLPGRRVVSVISGSHGSTVPVPVSRPLTRAFRDPSDTEHVTLTL